MRNPGAPWQPPPGRPVWDVGDQGSSWEAASHSASVSPGPPPAQLLYVLGGAGVFGVAWSILRPSRDVADPMLQPATAAQIKQPSVRSKAPVERADVAAVLVKKPSPSSYYKERAKKSEPSNIFNKRPHSKMRGSLYISPLHAAAEDGKAEWLYWVGERSGVSLRLSLDRQMQTPLHYAAREGQAEACAVLLNFQASPHERCKEGKTPLDLARENGHLEVLQMLQKGGRGPLHGVQFRQPGGLRSQNAGICG